MLRRNFERFPPVDEIERLSPIQLVEDVPCHLMAIHAPGALPDPN
jgi:hypothetical protein